MKSPEQQAFEATTSVNQLSDNYQASLNAVVLQTNDVMGNLGTWDTNFQYSGMGLYEFLERRTEIVGDTLSDTSKRIGAIIAAAPGVIDGLSDLTAYDRRIYADARHDFHRFPLHTALYNLNKNNPDPLTRDIVRIGLDNMVYRDARKVCEYSPVAGKYAMDKGASSSHSLQAMKFGVDDLIFKQGYETAQTSHVAGRHFITTHGSVKKPIRAMITGLDSLVLDSALRMNTTSRIAAEHYVTTHSSSKDAASLILNHLGAANPPRTNASTPGGSEWSERVRQTRREAPKREAPRSETPQKEAAPKPKAEKTPYQLLLADLRTKDRNMFETVRSFEEPEVARVIATVKHLREKDPDITDKQIAIKYARASNNSEATTPERKRATQIVMALMGNQVSGKLPF